MGFLAKLLAALVPPVLSWVSHWAAEFIKRHLKKEQDEKKNLDLKENLEKAKTVEEHENATRNAVNRLRDN